MMQEIGGSSFVKQVMDAFPFFSQVDQTFHCEQFLNTYVETQPAYVLKCFLMFTKFLPHVFL